MRRFAVVVAMMGIFTAQWAKADPFEQLSDRLAEYEEQIGGGAAMQPQSPESVAPEPIPEGAETVPAPVPQPDSEFGFYPDEGAWQEPMMPDGCCDSCCNRCGEFWGRAEYLVWWGRGARTPALVTTSPDGTAPDVAGILPDAQVVYGNERINREGRSGGRFTLGYWCDPCYELGIENTFFFVGNPNDSFFASSTGSPILALPFFNTNPTTGDPRQDALLRAYPDLVSGDIHIVAGRNVVGNDVNVRRAVYVDCCRRIDLLGGYRYFRMGERLNMFTNTTSLSDDSGAPTGTTFAIQDLFNTVSNFNGGQLGLNFQYTRCCWTLDVMAKLAIGGVAQRVVINGSTVRTLPGEDPESFTGGVLALASNIGTYKETRFGILPELDVNLRYQWSPLWTVNLGYTFMGLTNVVRPGDQIDTNLDPDQFPPPVAAGTSPAFSFHDSDMWLQGLNFGIECNF